MEKRGQLGIIEFKYFMVGLLIGLILSFVGVFLTTKDILHFKIPFVCGSALLFKNKKAQLAGIEFHYFLAGLGIGLIGGLVLVSLSARGVIPDFLSFLCPAVLKN